jgi:protoheme IX farnesyltransferase
VISGSTGLGTAHRVLAALALPPLAAVVAAAWISYRRLLPPSLVALVLFGLAAAVTAPGLHLALSALAFGASVVVAAMTFRGAPAPAGSARDYVTLTKPRIMSLLLLTGFCGMVVGAGGLPPLSLVVVTMLGLALACGGASALNHVLDADIDRLMGKRTRSRPVAAGRVPAPYALEFGLALSAFSFVLLAGAVNVLTAALALVGNLFYVLVYTRLLKRSTPQNIVIGGAAGAVPPLVGWAAATGDLTLPALVLFGIVFLWTPPHFWALALLIKRDYAAAGVPMLPVVRGEDETAKQIVLYTLALVAFTLAPALWGMFGPVYLVAATALGGLFLALAWMLRRQRTPRRAALLFHYSLLYLALLFVAMALDAVIA